MSKHISRSIVILTLLLFAAMFLSFDRVATARLNLDQNANSSTTQNTNATQPRRPTKRTPAKPSPQTTTSEPSMPAADVRTEAPAVEAAPPATRRNRAAQKTTTGESNTAQMMAAEQTDLSGTYTGTFDCDVAGLSGETTLTINGNEFTTADGKSGRIVATTTRGYTAVVLQLNNASGTAPTIVSLRARKSGNRLTLMPVSGATSKCTFTPTRSRRGVRQAPPVTPAPATEASPSPSPDPSQTPSPSPTPSPSATPDPGPTPSPSPTPDPSPTTSPSPTPEPSPTSSPTPTPNPSPTASPSPTPTPSPTPSPKPRQR